MCIPDGLPSFKMAEKTMKALIVSCLKSAMTLLSLTNDMKANLNGGQAMLPVLPRLKT